jgi:hypothetical protein
MLERLCGPNIITVEGDVLPAARQDKSARALLPGLLDDNGPHTLYYPRPSQSRGLPLWHF